MADQHMPAKIWVRVCGGGISLPSGKPYTTFVGEDREADARHVYVRSDLDAKMTEALEAIASFPVTEPGNMDAVNMQRIAKVALSAFRDSGR